MKRVIGSMLFAGLCFVSAGCRTTCDRPSWCHRNDPPPAKAVFVAPPPPCPAPLLPAQVQPQPIQQSGGFPMLPPGALTNPPPNANFVQPTPTPSISKSPREETQWKPSETREPPEPESKRDVPPRIQLYAPEAIDKDRPDPSKEPPERRKRSLPAIPQFAEVKANVFAGLRPSLDGLDWLQDEGVKTIVQIRLFGEDDSADQKQVEKRNMRYIAFEVSPVTLTKEKAEEFVKLIRDGARQGVFVYDQDGSLAGSMWYLYLRMGEVLDDEPSRLRARSLGLQTNRDGQHRDMWLAVPKVLNENSK
jgi:protein tyrosine phosphatase (PTP) superfamily phosphohydrolase (DUF442 family)